MSIAENKKLIKAYFAVSNPESIKSKKPGELEP
jgi:hypothetical protein